MSIDGVLKLKVQIMGADRAAIGPGKALVLETIDQHGSIAAAGRALGMSYRRIWLLTNELSSDWRHPVIETTGGGGRDAGTRLTAFGRDLLGRYRALEERMMSAGYGDDLNWLRESLAAPNRADNNATE